MRIAILDAATTEQGVDCWAPLRALGEVVVHPRSDPAQARERAAGADAVLINKVPVTPELLAAAPALGYVGVLATGYNIVDLDACRRRGVAVANVPGYSTESVAQLVFAFLLQHACDVAGHTAVVGRGGWAAGPDFCFALQPLRELHGKTLGIVGSGAIGSSVARIAAGFGMRVLRCAVPGSASQDRIPLAEALPQLDAVTLHCPLTSATTRLVDAAFLARLKPGAVLVNTGRGGLIDEMALAAALAGGRLGAACLDVLTAEPPPADHPLLRREAPWAGRLLVTPHIGWATEEARVRLVAEAAENLRAFTAGQRRNRVD
ncbi:MAG: D-2-hydroxyacid dehydrogenase [Planctomycetes bacterium]|nr:D-2-hydroxyacid dehydrogenase [Planctomycetota bacterium]